MRQEPSHHTAIDAMMLLELEAGGGDGTWVSALLEALGIDAYPLRQYFSPSAAMGRFPQTAEDERDGTQAFQTLVGDALERLAGSAAEDFHAMVADRCQSDYWPAMRGRLAAVGFLPDVVLAFAGAMRQKVHFAGAPGLYASVSLSGAWNRADADLTLPGGITWFAEPDGSEAIILGGAELPTDVVMHLPGRPLTDVFEHPAIGDEIPTIGSAIILGTGSIRLALRKPGG